MIDDLLRHDRRGFVHKRIIGAVVGGVTSIVGGGNPLAGAVRGFRDSRGGGGRPSVPCANRAFIRNPDTGICGPALGSVQRGAGLGVGVVRAPGLRGLAAAILPFGDPGFRVAAVDGGGEVVLGGFGIPAMVPMVVGSIQRRDGSVGPILKCIAGMVLAKDNLCYQKGTKGLAAFRKWKPGAKGLISPKDVRCLRRANTLRSSKTNKAVFKELGLGG